MTINIFNPDFNEDEKYLKTLEPAWAKAAYYFRTGIHFGHADRELRVQSLLQIHQLLEIFRTRVESGDTLSLLHAIAACAKENLPLPTWLEVAHRIAFNSFLSDTQVSSLDAVFSSAKLSTKTHKRNAAIKQDWQLGLQLVHAMWSVVISDNNLPSFEAALKHVMLQKNWGVKKTKARELIVMVDENQAALVPTYQGFSRFFELRQKL